MTKYLYILFTFSIINATSITNDGSVLHIESGNTLTIPGDLENSTGSIILDGKLEVGGQIINNDIFTININSHLVLNGSNQTIFGENFHDLTFSGSGIKTLNGNINVEDDFTLDGPTIDLNGFDLTNSW